jgi:hypothetical protein
MGVGGRGGGSFPDVKQPGRGVDHPSTYTAEVRIEYGQECRSTPMCVCMVRYGKTFTFYFPFFRAFLPSVFPIFPFYSSLFYPILASFLSIFVFFLFFLLDLIHSIRCLIITKPVKTLERREREKIL